MEEETETAIFDVSAAVGELRRCDEVHGVSRADRVELIFASLTVSFEEIFEIVEETVGIAKN